MSELQKHLKQLISYVTDPTNRVFAARLEDSISLLVDGFAFTISATDELPLTSKNYSTGADAKHLDAWRTDETNPFNDVDILKSKQSIKLLTKQNTIY
jgi:hypothetical protein